jgi:DNA polymerase-3 subunit gamma/tau
MGPTDTPCGECPSCRELARDGGGSLDVVEIDAASHNGVDDARDLRERAVFAPARDRYKIFILDEAHMVTQQGFNALLKIVEEPPEHVKFIFATTEPDKVIGTIRSRTHHYPFRLVPPADLLAYIEEMCVTEAVTVEDGVLPLVVRAGGGSVRDTLSVLDQLIAGSPEPVLRYEHAIGLLGYTHGELLAEVMSALAGGNGRETFVALDKVINTGQDPRRFGEDLLEYVRDLIIVDQAGEQAASLLPGSSPDRLAVMADIAGVVGTPGLSRMADVMSEALASMTGATSPTLHLELLMARLLVAQGNTPHAPASRGVSGLPPQSTDHQSAGPALTAPPEIPLTPPEPLPGPQDSPDTDSGASLEPLTLASVESLWPAVMDNLGERKRTIWSSLVGTQVLAVDGDILTIGFPTPTSAEVLKKPQGPGLGANAELVRESILAITGHRVRFKVSPLPQGAPDDLAPEPPEVSAEPGSDGLPAGPLTESSRDALAEIPAEESNAGASTEPVEAPTESQPQPQPQTQSTAITGAEADPAPTSSAAGSWPTVVPPRSAVEESQDIVAEVAVEPEQEAPPTAGSFSQIGEAVIREVLGGELISEHPVEQEKEA